MNRSHPRKRQNKEKLYGLFAQIATAMANPHRLELLDLLVQAPFTVEELAREAHMSIANTSQHLQRLKRARLVVAEHQGIYRRYRLADPAVAHLWLQLRSVAERQLAEVAEAVAAYREKRDEFEAISAADLLTRLEKNEVILLDVRSTAEYESSHLEGAVSIPWFELDRRLGELPRSQKIVAYCRGPYCVYADEALEILKENGWQTARLEEGIVEWEQLGYTLKRSE